MKKIVLLWAALTLLAVSAEAQLTSRRSSVHSTGSGTVSVKPDLLKVNVGVSTTAKTAAEAADANANITTSVIAALKKVVGSTGEIKTVGYSVTPNYKYSQAEGTSTLTGFTATNTVQVSTSDLSLGGKLIDAGVQSGATNVQSLRFTLKDSEAAQVEALRLATAQAKVHAEAIASGLNARLGYVISASESSGVSSSVYDARTMAASGSGTTTPVETGMVDVSATVSLEIELIP
jgi:uncharacterized protein YggE